MDIASSALISSEHKRSHFAGLRERKKEGSGGSHQAVCAHRDRHRQPTTRHKAHGRALTQRSRERKSGREGDRERLRERDDSEKRGTKTSRALAHSLRPCSFSLLSLSLSRSLSRGPRVGRAGRRGGARREHKSTRARKARRCGVLVPRGSWCTRL